MIKILVKFIGRPYNATNKRHVWIYFDSHDEVTLRDLLNKIEVEIGVRFDVGKEGIIALINGRNAHYMGGLNANLKDLDEVII
ncbi:MAG: hypothetical protein QXE73_06945, partial [Candidatus Bathyarchaeia archaeon]